MKFKDVKPEVYGITFGVFILSLLYFLIKVSEKILNNPDFETYLKEIAEGSKEILPEPFKLVIFILTLIVINWLIYKLISHPKKTLLGRGSMMFYLTYSLSGHGLKKFSKRVFVTIFRPFITDDKSNQASLYLFINLSLVIIFFETSPYVTNVSYSIIGAVVFQYFIMMKPQERKKAYEGNKLLSSCRTIRVREQVLFESLGYDSPVLLNKILDLSNKRHTLTC